MAYEWCLNKPVFSKKKKSLKTILKKKKKNHIVRDFSGSSVVKTPPGQGMKGPACCKTYCQPSSCQFQRPLFPLPLWLGFSAAWQLPIPSSCLSRHHPLRVLSCHSPRLLSFLCWLLHQPLNAGGPKALCRAFLPSLLILYSFWSLFNPLPLIYFINFYFLVKPRGMWDLSSPTWDGACNPCLGSTES